MKRIIGRIGAYLHFFIGFLPFHALPAQTNAIDFNAAPHSYGDRQPRDRFARFKEQLESGSVILDRSTELAFLASLLRALEIPASSQMLVFSTTSLQLSLISPANPRALYFNEEIYVGYVPGGKIEVIAVDPEMGGVFYIFDLPKGQQPLRIERSNRCMNCHVNEETRQVPGLVIKSVVPGPSGGSLTAFRIGLTGHEIPLEQRFGGWHVTGEPGFTNHWGNLTGRFREGVLTRIPNPPGGRFDFNRYPVATSGLLPQLLHEHQAGFVNRVVEAAYRCRELLPPGKDQLSPEQAGRLDSLARDLTRYLLFADEAALPRGGITSDPPFVSDFLKNRRVAASGVSLKDLDLKTRLLRHRCSYMIYSPAFAALPKPMKQAVYARIDRALAETDPDYSYLRADERGTLRVILRATLDDLPPGW